VKHIVQATVSLAALAMISCSGEEPPMSGSQVKEKAQEAVSATTQYIEQEKQEFVKNTQESMRDLESNMNELKKDIQAAGGKGDAQLQPYLKSFDNKLNSAQARLAALKDTSSEAWQDMKQGMQDAVADLRQSYNQAVKEFESRG